MVQAHSEISGKTAHRRCNLILILKKGFLWRKDIARKIHIYRQTDRQIDRDIWNT